METNELGRAKKTRRAYGFDEISLAPSIVTINPDDTDVSVKIGKYKFDIPIIASAMDGVVSPKLAVQMSKLGGLGVLNLQGVWARYEDADKILQQISSVSREEYVPLMQKLYLEPIKKDLIIKRIKEIKDAGGITIAQKLDTAKQPDMPESAIASGAISQTPTSGAPGMNVGEIIQNRSIQ